MATVGSSDSVRRSKIRRWAAGCRPRSFFPILVLAGVLLCGCEVWRIEKGLKTVDYEIQEAEGLEMQEAALYHLTVARSLLEAAKKQYEEADFTDARRFLDQSERQLKRAQKLNALSKAAPPSRERNMP